MFNSITDPKLRAYAIFGAGFAIGLLGFFPAYLLDLQSKDPWLAICFLITVIGVVTCFVGFLKLWRASFLQKVT